MKIIKGYIYLFYRKSNNSSCYVGKHNGNNDEYFTNSTILKQNLKEWGEKRFWEYYSKEIIHENITTSVELNLLEIKYIKQYNTYIGNNSKGYNLTKGGDGGDNFTNHPNKEEIRKKFSERSAGIKNNMYGKSRPCGKDSVSYKNPKTQKSINKQRASLKKHFKIHGHHGTKPTYIEGTLEGISVKAKARWKKIKSDKYYNSKQAQRLRRAKAKLAYKRRKKNVDFDSLVEKQKRSDTITKAWITRRKNKKNINAVSSN